MSKQLFKALLSKEFFNSISDDLPEEDFFPVELRSLYKVLVQAHLQYSGDITPDTLSDLFSIKYPTITPAAKLVVDATLNSLNELPEYNPSIANDIILTYKTQDIVRLAISKLLDVESNKASIEELIPLIDQYQAIEARLTTSVSEEVTLDEMVSLDDFENLLVEGDIEHKWKFNYPPLQGATNGLPESCFGIVAARPDCYSSDTEVLTSMGWKLFKDLEGWEYVAQVHDNKDVTYTAPTAFTKYKYEGDMVHLTHSMGRIDLLVTPNHDLVIEDSKGVLQKVKAKDFKPSSNTRMLNSGGTRGRSSLTPYERFLIAYQADGSGPRKGCTGERGHVTVRFGFSKQRKVDRLIEILKEAGLTYRVKNPPSRPNYTMIYVECLSTPSKVFDWVAPALVFGDWGKEFIEELSYWDATRRTDTRIKYDSTVKLNTDAVAMVCALSGYHTNQSVQVDKRGHSDVHTITIRTNTDGFSTRPIKKELVPYNDYVYCVTVPEGRLIVRRNGKITVCGNCGKTAFYLSLTCNNGGFVHQGANVAVWRNEEAYTMVARRAISSLLDTPYEEAVLNVEAYHKKRSTIEGNVFILKDKVTGDKSIKDIDNYLKDHPEIDILIIDQLDGVLYKGQRAGDDVGILGALYTEARAIAARRNVAIIAITQAGAEAEGKLYYGLNGLYGSKTNKQATADFIFCLGAMPVQQGEQDSGVRAINFAKNKLKGPHKPIIYTLQHNVSRIGA